MSNTAVTWNRLVRPSRAKGLIFGLIGVIVVALMLNPFKDDLAVATPAPLFLLPVLLAGLFGGRATAALVAGFGALVYWLEFVPPLRSLGVPLAEDTVSIVFFFAVALMAGTLIAGESEARREATARADELAVMHDRLETAIRERDALEAETRRIAVLEEVDRQRSAMLRAVSHDLRTPLSTIRAAAGELEGSTSFTVEDRRELTRLVVSESERLDRIVANLLSMSRVEAGAMTPTMSAVDLCEVIDRCTARLAPLLTHLIVDRGPAAAWPLVYGDDVLLDQVFTNLFENVARHAPTATTVVIEARWSEDELFVSFADDGLGVGGLGHPDNLFAPFLRANDSAGGTGLGLAVSRALVEACGGTLELDASHVTGARFLVTLDRCPSEDLGH